MAFRPADRRGEEVGLATDVDIGVDALEALEQLAAAGYSFAWHPEQDPLNRSGEPYGVAVAAAPS